MGVTEWVAAPLGLVHTLLLALWVWASARLQKRLYITFRMSTVLLFLVVMSGIAAMIVRYRLLTKYSRLPEDPALNGDTGTAAELWLESAGAGGDEDYVDEFESPKASYGSYFDEFLSAIRVFGYIDRKVFHELTRHMTTVRVDEGEHLRLKDLGGFAVVIDGAMQVFCGGEDGELELLNEVNRSAPISSLSSILSLFTEDVELNENLRRQQENTNDTTIPKSEFENVNNSVVAVAREPSTIIVIPAEAFRRLTQRYPKATANIVQVILFRWSQVTLRTCQRYLNLTDQIYSTELRLNRYALNTDFPDWLRESAVQRLRALSRSHPNEFEVKLEAPASRDQIYDAKSPTYPGDLITSSLSKHSSTTSIQNMGSPGSLPSGSLPKGSRPPTSTLPSRRDSMLSEDSLLRRALIECMFTIMGFDTKLYEKPCVNEGVPRSRETSMEPEGSTDSEGVGSTPPPQAALYDQIVDDAARRLQILWCRKGATSFQEQYRGMVFVLDGTLEVGTSAPGKPYKRLHDVNPGSVTGYLETISSYSSFVSVVPRTDVCVAVLTKRDFEVLADTYPPLYISAAKTLTTVLSRPIVQLDFALEWVSVKSGAQLFRQDHQADAIYFVLNGRLRAIQNGKTVVGEFGQGSSVGELEVLVGDRYAATTVAVRETELARFPRTMVESLARQHPAITFEMTRMVAQSIQTRSDPSPQFHTVAVLPTAEGLPVQEFADKLAAAYRQNGKSVMVLTNAVVLGYLGKYAFQRMGVLKLKAWLSDLEDRFEALLYVADSSATAAASQWTRTCVDQADCVLLLADAQATPQFGDCERLLVKSRTSSRAHLVLLHQDQVVEHGSTARWLKHRPWVSAHHHIELPFKHPTPDSAAESGTSPQSRARKRLQKLKDELMTLHRLTSRRRPVPARHHVRYKNDFNRLARILSGDAVGVVLGGGGARGLAHIGVLQALEEAGIPVDMVGGTSIGSFIGGLYAREYDVVPLFSRAKKFAFRVASVWRMVLDVTYPSTAWTTGHEFNRGLWKAFGDSRIEDFWIRYFANTTNLTHSRMEIHQRGYAWRYIRASMSLAGLVPPLEENGQMLLDGGYVDNLPVMEMKRMGARYIIAVDVGAVDDTTPLKYGDSLSGVWALLNRWNPLSTTPNVPNMAEIQQRLAYVSSVKALEDAKTASGVVYLRPPIDTYGTLEFGRFDEVVDVGHTYGVEVLREKFAAGEFPKIPGAVPEKERPRMRFRRYSY